MKYAILRTQKLKSAHAVRRSLMHAFREQETPNADPARKAENTHIGANSTVEALDRFNQAMPEKVRKNGVLAVEYLVTASPEAMQGKSREQQDRYFKDALKWLQGKHGAENVIYAGIHRDEITPHMYAYVVPKDENGKLNCRKFLGGAKALSEMQTDFYQKVGKSHDLERGIEGSKARHQRVKQFYAQIGKETGIPEITPEELKPQKSVPDNLLGKLKLQTLVETPDGVCSRLNEKIRVKVAPLKEKAAISDSERRRRQELEKTNKELNRRLKWLEERFEKLASLFRGLTEPQQRKVLELSESFKQENKVIELEKKQKKDIGLTR